MLGEWMGGQQGGRREIGAGGLVGLCLVDGWGWPGGGGPLVGAAGEGEGGTNLCTAKKGLCMGKVKNTLQHRQDRKNRES